MRYFAFCLLFTTSYGAARYDAAFLRSPSLKYAVPVVSLYEEVRSLAMKPPVYTAPFFIEKGRVIRIADMVKKIGSKNLHKLDERSERSLLDHALEKESLSVAYFFIRQGFSIRKVADFQQGASSLFSLLTKISKEPRSIDRDERIDVGVQVILWYIYRYAPDECTCTIYLNKVKKCLKIGKGSQKWLQDCRYAASLATNCDKERDA